MRTLKDMTEKTTTLLRDLEFFIPSKLNENQSSDSEEKVENVIKFTTDGRQRGRRTTRYENRSLELSAQVS